MQLDCIFYLFKKIVCLDRKKEVEKQGYQGNITDTGEMPSGEVFSFSNLLQTKRLPWSFLTNISWTLPQRKPMDICLTLVKSAKSRLK